MKTLILFAHPRLEKSRSNKALLSRLKPSPDLTFNDLYENYPDFNIDVEREKNLLLAHDLIIWQHPFYWYSCPPLLKQWIDLVLEFEWAYGPGGNALQGKFIFNSITTGGAQQAYQPTGHNHYTIKQFLHPFEQTARLCKMHYLPPFAVQGTHKLTVEQLEGNASQYEAMIKYFLGNKPEPEQYMHLDFLNQMFEPINQ